MIIIPLIILTIAAIVIVVLSFVGIRGFRRGFRQGLREDAPEHAPLRTTLFRTVLVTLLVLFLLVIVIVDRQQPREDQWPADEGLAKLDRFISRGEARWIDDEAHAAIRQALLDATDAQGSGGGTVFLDGTMITDLTPATTARLEERGWDVGQGLVGPEDRDWRYVAWRTSDERAVLYVYDPAPWWSHVVQYLLSLLIGLALLSPFAAVAAWYLNRRIVKPVQQVAHASVVLADGGIPVAIPTKAPLELSVMAQSFNRMARKLKKAQDTERDFLMSVGHELKTPLTAIDGYAELLQDGAVAPGEAAEVLSAESGRLRRLITDLLDLARIDRSEFTVVDEPVDLADTAREAVARFEGLAGSLGVALVADAAEPAPARGDAGRLLQVASNLVENALRATSSGGRVEVVARPGRLSVRDTGPGLTEKDLDHAFERFYLHRKYSTGPTVGTGLGLAIVKDLTEAMGGSVEAESEPGEGSTFTIDLATT
ncbi:MAG TPA: HAMP domain-containing sensor histidine kinase [Thermoleophilia bacterium]|nr:HAMP domain-containing sensor histidine kinase [Thermoleophilia bacterium]